MVFQIWPKITSQLIIWPDFLHETAQTGKSVFLTGKCNLSNLSFLPVFREREIISYLSAEESSFVFYFLTCLIVKLDRPVDLPALLGDVKLDLKLLLPHVITGTQMKQIVSISTLFQHCKVLLRTTFIPEMDKTFVQKFITYSSS